MSEVVKTAAEETVEKKLTPKDIRQCTNRLYIGAEMSNSYERLQALVFLCFHDTGTKEAVSGQRRIQGGPETAPDVL